MTREEIGTSRESRAEQKLCAYFLQRALVPLAPYPRAPPAGLCPANISYITIKLLLTCSQMLARILLLLPDLHKSSPTSHLTAYLQHATTPISNR